MDIKQIKLHTLKSWGTGSGITHEVEYWGFI